MSRRDRRHSAVFPHPSQAGPLGIAGSVLNAGGAASYASKVLGTQSGSLIGFWRLNETSGTTAADSSQEENDGSYNGTGLTLADGSGPDGSPVPHFDGSDAYVHVHSAAFAADFNGQSGTLIQWVKMNAASVWTDATNRRIANFLADGSNFIYLRKGATSNQIIAAYVAAGTDSSVLINSYNPTVWFCLVQTWDLSAGASGEYKVYTRAEGGSLVQQGATATGLGTFSGSPSSSTSTLGAANTTPAEVHSGWLGPGAMWNVALTESELETVTDPSL